MTLFDALIDAGRRRFRPVMLTSVTTIAGLTPMLTETSFQAQFLIPLAATLVFGLLVATGLVLILIPTLYSVYERYINGAPLYGKNSRFGNSSEVADTVVEVVPVATPV